jgi:hypothetical protein
MYKNINFRPVSQHSSTIGSRGDRYLSHRSRHTQVPVPATTALVKDQTTVPLIISKNMAGVITRGEMG